jgi:hypothetical protein
VEQVVWEAREELQQRFELVLLREKQMQRRNLFVIVEQLAHKLIQLWSTMPPEVLNRR